MNRLRLHIKYLCEFRGGY